MPTNAACAKDEHFLARFFEPRSVAVVGASNNPSRITYYLVSNLLKLGFQGSIYPVNPGEREIQGLRAYPSVKDLPETVDLVVIGVSYAKTPEVLKEAVGKGIKRATLIAGGFSEAGEQGKRVQSEMLRLVRQNGIRVIGPNALSPIHVKAGLCFSFHPMERIKAGRLSLIFQSGLYEPRSGWLLNDFNYHLNKLIDLGNKMDVNEVDALSYLAEDPETHVIGIHLESIAGQGIEFLRQIRKASARGKRVVVLKSGRSEAGARAALSHTGSMALGNDRLFDGAMRQCGALRAQSLEDFFELTRALERFGPLSMKGNGVFIATFPGGEGVIVTDLLEQEGLRLAETSSATLDKLRAIFPAWDIPANPWDLGLTVQFHHPGIVYPAVLDAMVADPNVAALALQIHPEFLTVPKEFMGIFLRALEAGKPIVLWLAGMESGRHENLAWLEDQGVPVFSTPEKAIRALAALHHLSRPQSSP